MIHVARPVVRASLVAAATVAATASVLAQQTVPFRNDGAVLRIEPAS